MESAHSQPKRRFPRFSWPRERARKSRRTGERRRVLRRDPIAPPSPAEVLAHSFRRIACVPAHSPFSPKRTQRLPTASKRDCDSTPCLQRPILSETQATAHDRSCCRLAISLPWPRFSGSRTRGFSRTMELTSSRPAAWLTTRASPRPAMVQAAGRPCALTTMTIASRARSARVL